MCSPGAVPHGGEVDGLAFWPAEAQARKEQPRRVVPAGRDRRRLRRLGRVLRQRALEQLRGQRRGIKCQPGHGGGEEPQGRVVAPNCRRSCPRLLWPVASNSPPMPRPRKPLELLELTGTYRPDRHGQRRDAPKSERPIGDPPGHLTPDEAAAAGVLPRHPGRGADLGRSVGAGDARAPHRQGPAPRGAASGRARPPAGPVGEMGATPASRSKVLPAGPAEAPAVGNPWDVLPPGRV